MYQSPDGKKVLDYLKDYYGVFRLNPTADPYTVGQRDVIINIINIVYDTSKPTAIDTLKELKVPSWTDLGG